MSELVGILTVSAAENQHRSFEYAGAGEVWNLDAAEVEIYKSGAGNYWFVGKRPGTRVDSWFQNRIGASLGSNNRDTTPKIGFVGVQFDAYGAGHHVLKGALKLADGWECVIRGHYSDGEPMAVVRHSDPTKRYEGI